MKTRRGTYVIEVSLADRPLMLVVNAAVRGAGGLSHQTYEAAAAAAKEISKLKYVVRCQVDLTMSQRVGTWQRGRKTRSS